MWLTDLPPGKQLTLAARIDALFHQQTKDWRLLRENIRNRSLAETRTFLLGDFPVAAQCNPDRLASTTAGTEKDREQNRSCKLCVENLFEEQERLACGDGLFVLCNPYPVLERHLSIVSRTHSKQAIRGRLPGILDLAKDLSPDYFVFYNGPKCGASVPEHFHLQACSREHLPLNTHLKSIENNAARLKHKQYIVLDEDIEVFAMREYHVALLVYRAASRTALTASVNETLANMAALTRTSEEPLINLLVMFEDPKWTVCLFPRQTHRPTSYFDRTFIVSPACLDLAGWLVVPIKEHFDRISPQQVAEVYAEVTLEAEGFSRLIDSIAR